MKRILNVEPSPKRDDDWTFEYALGAEVVDTEAPLPTSRDLRADWWRVGDQGSTGSCVGWSTVDSVLRWHFVKERRIEETDKLSPRFVWMASKETDISKTRPTTFIEAEGTHLKAALDIARKFGVVKERVLPFGSGALYPREAKMFYAIAAKLKIRAYFNLGRNLDNWRVWLATKGPILTRLEVDPTWHDADKTKGVLTDYQRDKTEGGHAVALVGYGPDRFIVRNSWGTTWGDKGFAYASLDYAREAFDEAYGVEV